MKEENDYFGQYFGEEDDFNNNKDVEGNNNNYSKNQKPERNNNFFLFNANNIFSNNSYKNLSSSFNTFNSFNSTNPGNFNSFSHPSNFNSMNSLNPNLTLSFQNRNNKNIFQEININQNLSDNKIKYNTAMSIKKITEINSSNLYNYIITQKGSREMQTLINKMKENEVEILLAKICPYISEIIMDKYGNYFSKKLIQICLPYQRIKLLKQIENNFIIISKSPFGTHPLQCLIETINMNEEKNLVLKYILNKELELSLDPRGVNVLKKFIISTNDEERKELNNNLIKNISELIINQYGVIILITLIKNSKDKNIFKTITEYINNNNPLFFIQHPYSNYVIQALLIHTNQEFCEDIIKNIINNYLNLSLQKNSNKVVENCIKYGKSSTIKKIFNNILEENNLICLLNNYYGKFVIEKLIAKLNKDEKNMIIKKLEENENISEIYSTIKNLLYK